MALTQRALLMVIAGAPAAVARCEVGGAGDAGNGAMGGDARGSRTELAAGEPRDRLCQRFLRRSLVTYHAVSPITRRTVWCVYSSHRPLMWRWDELASPPRFKGWYVCGAESESPGAITQPGCCYMESADGCECGHSPFLSPC
jgi:hypothetical protein